MADRMFKAEQQILRLRRALHACLDYERESAKFRGLADCTCILHSRKFEIKYENLECPHQLARQALHETSSDGFDARTNLMEVVAAIARNDKIDPELLTAAEEAIKRMRERE